MRPSSGIAYKINDSGQVVGGSDGSPFCGGQMLDLNTLVTANSGWVLRSASAINDAGQIVGTGYYQGQPRAFLLTPNTVVPEPSTYALCGLTLLGTTGRVCKTLSASAISLSRD